MNLQDQHQIKNEFGDGLVGAAAKFAATRLTRRSLVCRLGHAAAALMGAEFLVANGPRAVATVVGKSPCQFSQTNPCGANGILCGVESQAYPCSQLASCKDCLVDGCPQGTQPEAHWTGCCLCTNEMGTVKVNYTDCCSATLQNQTQLPAVCQPCLPMVKDPCTGRVHSSTLSWCQGSLGFCDEALGSDTYICTRVTSTNTACSPP